MKWILILVTVLYSGFSYSSVDYQWIQLNRGGGSFSYTYQNCERYVKDKLDFSIIQYPKKTNHTSVIYSCTEPVVEDKKNGYVSFGIFALDANSCPDGYEPSEYPSTQCSAIPPNYCDTEESFQAAENAVMQCASGVPIGQTVTENTATCNRDTETIDSICVYSTVGDGGDGGGSDGSGDDGIGGGDGGSGDIGSGDGGSGDGNTGTTTDNICSQYPDLCVTGDCVPPPDMPWVCDVPTGEGTDLIAKVSEITRLLAINNSSTEQDVLNSAMSLVNDDAEINNQVKTLDKLETIKSNSKATADNTNKITDHLQNITDLSKYQNELLGKLIDKPSGDGVPSDLMAGVESKLDGIKAELSKSFCQKNPTHNDCRNIVISDAYQDVFNSPELSNMEQKTADIKNELQSKIEDFKNLLGNPNIQAGGAIDEINFTLAHAGKQIEVSNTAAQDIGVQVKALVLAVFSVMGLMIICRR